MGGGGGEGSGGRGLLLFVLFFVLFVCWKEGGGGGVRPGKVSATRMITACLQAYHSGVRLRGHGQTSRTAARQNVQGRRSPRQMLNPNTRQANGTIAVLFQKLLDPPLHARPSFTDEQIHKGGKENIPTKLITHSEEETQLLGTGRSERRRK